MSLRQIFTRVNILKILESINWKWYWKGKKIVKSFKLIEIYQILLLIIITTEPACNYETNFYWHCIFYTVFLRLFYRSIYYFEKQPSIKDFSIPVSFIGTIRNWINLLYIYCLLYHISSICKQPLKDDLWNGCSMQLGKIQKM